MLKSRIRIFSTSFTNNCKVRPYFTKLHHFIFWVKTNYCKEKYYY